MSARASSARFLLTKSALLEILSRLECAGRSAEGSGSGQENDLCALPSPRAKKEDGGSLGVVERTKWGEEPAATRESRALVLFAG